MASVEALKKIARISKYTGFTSLCYFLNRNRKKTIAYHNVIPDELWDDSLHLDHSMKESSFKKQVEVIKKRFKVDLDIDNSKTLTITFDDGYLNQFTIASKILDDNNIKAYFFCVDDLINNKKTLDMDVLQFWVSYVPYGKYLISKINLELNINSEADRELCWKKISDKLDEGIKLIDMVVFLNESYQLNEIINSDTYNKEMYKLRFSSIDIENIQAMKNKGNLIGAHSAKHLRLSTLNKEALEEDIRICADNIDKLYNTKVFCYPYGSVQDISNKVIDVVKGNGFEKAFAYSNGALKGYKYNEYFIPRIFLPDSDDEDLIEFVLSGAKHLIAFKKLLP